MRAGYRAQKPNPTYVYSFHNPTMLEHERSSSEAENVAPVPVAKNLTKAGFSSPTSPWLEGKPVGSS